MDFIIPSADRKKGTLDLVIESSCNGMFGVPWSGDTIDPPDVRCLCPELGVEVSANLLHHR